MVTVAVALGLMAAVSACSRAVTPLPAPAPTPAEPVPTPVVVPALVRASLPATVTERRYEVRSNARVQRDSAGRMDEQRVETTGFVSLSLQRAADGALRGSGRVDSFAVRVDGAPPPPPVMTTLPSGVTQVGGTSRPPGSVPFDAILDGVSIRIVTRPPLANECDRPEAGATALVRDLLVRIPRSVAVGEQWRDSTASIVCRAGIPITVRSAHRYVMLRIEGEGATSSVIVQRSTTTRLDGVLQSSWRALELTGTGTGREEARVEISSGALQQLRGDGTMTLQVTDRSRPGAARTQRVSQQLTTEVNLRR